MATLTKDTVRVYELGNINEFPLAGGANIYQGAAVGANTTGYARSLQTSDTFLGFAEDHVNNTNGLDGAKNIRVRKRGSALLEISGVALADLNKSVYATNDNTFTLASTGNAAYIGQISRIDSNGIALVEFSASALPTVTR